MYLWQDDYIRALAETDPEKQLRLVYNATVAIEQRRLCPVEPGSEEASGDRTGGEGARHPQTKPVRELTLTFCSTVQLYLVFVTLT